MNANDRLLRWKDDVIVDAAPDVVARRLGAAARKGEHPLTDDITTDMSLIEISECVSRANQRDPSAMFTSMDFAPILAEAVQHVISISYDQVTDHRRISRTIVLKDYRATPIPGVDIEIDETLPPRNERGEWQSLKLFSSDGFTGRLGDWGIIFAILRSTLKNDMLGAIAVAISNMGAFAARREARHVFGILAMNPQFPDGREMFNATDGNLLSSAPLNATSLGIACAALRRQKTSAGNVSGCAPRFLLCAPEQEISALILVASLTTGQSGLQIEVIASPTIQAGTWYVLADPAIAPVIGFLTNGGKRQIEVSPKDPGFHVDGVGLQLQATHGVVPLSRVGAVMATQ